MKWHKKEYVFNRNVKFGPAWYAIGPIDVDGDDWDNSTTTLIASLKVIGDYETVYEQEGIVFARTATDETTQTYKMITYMKVPV